MHAKLSHDNSVRRVKNGVKLYIIEACKCTLICGEKIQHIYQAVYILVIL